MAYATDTELEALDRELSDEDRVEALYYYLVKGWNMEEVGRDVLRIRSDQPGRLVSSLTRAYGFSGKNGGRYRQCSREDIADIIFNYLPWPCYRYGSLQPGEFDECVRKYMQRKNAAQKQQQERERERQRREREAAEAERRARENYQRQLARMRAEQAAAEEQKRKNAASHIQRGKAALARRDMQTAFDEFSAAWKLRPSPEVNLLLAETMATSGNAEKHGAKIIQVLSQYFSYLESINGRPTIEQYVWMARAYVAVGDKNRACTNYFAAGDMAYQNEDFVQANELYQESLNKTNYYENGAQFRVAFAYEKSRKKLTEKDHRYCISYYQRYLQEQGEYDYARGNLSYHYNCIKEYQNTIRWSLPAALRGQVTYFLKNLANAYYNTKQWAEAVKWYRKAAAAGLGSEDYLVACALEELGEYDEAKELFEELLISSDDPEDIYIHLLDIAENNYASAEELAEYRLELLKRDSWRAACDGEDWLTEAEDNGLEEMARQMLDYLPDVKRSRAEEGLAEAEAMATGSCPEAYAREIIEKLTAYIDAGETLSLEQKLWLARAYVADGEAAKASKVYFEVGDWHYLNGDYPLAHTIYQEVREKTGLTEGANLFHIAYACSTAEGSLTDEQHRYCIDCYQRYLEVEPLSDAARVNLGYHYNSLGEYENTIRWVLPAAQRGKNTVAFGNLANAYYNTQQWEDAIRWYEKAAEAGKERKTTLIAFAMESLANERYQSGAWWDAIDWYEKAAENGRTRASYRIACAKEQIGEYDEAKREFEALLDNSSDKGEIYAHLLSIAEITGAEAEEIAKYRLGILQHGVQHAHGNEAQWLEQTEKQGLSGMAERMLSHLPEIREEREKEAQRKADEEMLILLL